MQIISPRVRRALSLTLLAALAACGVSEQDAPPLTGPSGFAQSVTVAAAPDRLPQDGQSQAVVTISVRNENGQGVAGLRLIVSTTGGTLSQGEVVTGSDGRAALTLTAPAPTTPSPSRIDVFVTPVGSNSDTSVTRTASVSISSGANTTAPGAQFSFTPAEPGLRELVTFDASATQDEGQPCGTACTYSWNFGDGGTATGVMVRHAFTSAGTYAVTLTVADAAGTTGSREQLVTVAPSAAPSVSASVSPASPRVQLPATFTATSVAGAGRRIISYRWEFGDGTVQTGSLPTILHTYSAAGTYVVTLTVTDDAEQTASASLLVTVTTGVSADFTISPTDPEVGDTVQFDPRSSTIPPGITVAEYRWDFGNGQTATTTPSAPTTSTTYGSANTFTVRLTVVDSQGRTTTMTKSLVVSDP